MSRDVESLSSAAAQGAAPTRWQFALRSRWLLSLGLAAAIAVDVAAAIVLSIFLKEIFDVALPQDDGDYLRGPQFADLAVDAGLKEIPLGHLLNDKDWMDILQNRGAMLMLQESVGSWTHWIVLVGYEYSAKHELEIDYIDPADGRKWGEPAAKLYDKCLGAKTAYGRVYAY